MITDGPRLLETVQQTRGERRRRYSLAGPVAWCVAAVAILVAALALHRMPHGRAGLIAFVACIVLVAALNSARLVRRIIHARTKN